jgi:hypothetical protein
MRKKLRMMTVNMSVSSECDTEDGIVKTMKLLLTIGMANRGRLVKLNKGW